MLCGEHYGAPFDLLAAALGVSEERVLAIAARWRRAGYAETGRLGPGPGWCWLTRDGMTTTGLRFPAVRPALGRLAHIRAVLAARIWMADNDTWADGEALVAFRAAAASRPARRGPRRPRAGRGGPLAVRGPLRLRRAGLGDRGGADPHHPRRDHRRHPPRPPGDPQPRPGRIR